MLLLTETMYVMPSLLHSYMAAGKDLQADCTSPYHAITAEGHAS